MIKIDKNFDEVYKLFDELSDIDQRDIISEYKWELLEECDIKEFDVLLDPEDGAPEGKIAVGIFDIS